MRRNGIFLLALLSLLLWGAPVRAAYLPVRTGVSQQNKCAEQPFAGGSIQVTTDAGATYQPASTFAVGYMRGIYGCPITAPVVLGTYQPVGFLIDQTAIIVWSSPDGTRYYVHREWRVYVLTAAQWKTINALLSVKVGNWK